MIFESLKEAFVVAQSDIFRRQLVLADIDTDRVVKKVKFLEAFEHIVCTTVVESHGILQ